MMAEMPVKIAYLMDHYAHPYGGTEQQILKLIHGLDRQRFEPHVTVFRGSKYSSAADFGCPVNVLGIEKMARAATWARLYGYMRELSRNGFSLVHIFFNDAAMIAPPFAKLFGLRVVVSRRDMGFWYSATVTRMLRISRLFVDHVVANSEAVKRQVGDKEGYPGSKIAVIYNGFANRQGTPTQDPGTREKLGVPRDAKIVGIVANLRPIKRIDDLINAFGKLASTDPKLWLVVVGTGDLEGPLRDLAQSLGIGNRVVFAGQVTDVAPIIQQFTVAVLCSESEGFSNSIIEYMNCAKPSVCTKVGGNVEIVQDGYNGYLVDVGDIDALADRVRTLVSDQNLADAIGRHALNFVKDKFDVRKMVAAHEELYENLLSSRPTRVSSAGSAG